MINVDNIVAGVQEYAKPNRYRVEIFPPNTMINGKKTEEGFFASLVSDVTDYVTGKQHYGDIRTINLNCSGVSMPGLSYATKEIRTASGPLYKIPYDKIFEPITATFYLDVEHNSRRLFVEWMDAINKPSGQIEIDSNQFEFYNNYIGGMYIYQLDSNQLPSTWIDVKELYPSAISEIALAYENNAAIETFTVTFQYKTWELRDVNRLVGRLADITRGFL